MTPLVLLSLACGRGLASLEEGEWLPGGDTTNTQLLGRWAFSMPAQNLDNEHEQAFYGGNGYFKDNWVQAPSSTNARDGLGPLFHARSCSGCHAEDGRAAPPEDGLAPFEGLLLRLSLPVGAPDPVYGGQLQDQALEGVPLEAEPRITWTERTARYDDGAAYTLLSPSYTLDNPGYGAFAAELEVSPRIAPQLIGLGLLEAIPAERLTELADPDDADGDGVSGRAQLRDGALGRFGWKGDAPSVEAQVAGAFLGDMGLTSRLHLEDDCTASQLECLELPEGGEPEVDDTVLDRVVLYSRALAVPARRDAEDPQVLRGKQLFHELECSGCHVPSHQTGAAALPELEGQLIWPYTDLLLHDMGEGLADGRPLGEASGQEWKTPPLWGLGLVEDVNGHTRYLHDGRARSLEEAVLWHGGEAEAAQQGFVALPLEDREALLRFLEDL